MAQSSVGWACEYRPALRAPGALVEANGQVPETAEPHAPVALGHAREIDPRKTREQPPECYPRFHPRDVHPRAGVVAVPERDVAVRLAADVEAVRVGELRRIAVGRTDAEGDERSGRELAPAELDRCRRHPVVELERALEAQQLLDRGRHQRGIVGEARELAAVDHEGVRAVAK